MKNIYAPELVAVEFKTILFSTIPLPEDGEFAAFIRQCPRLRTMKLEIVGDAEDIRSKRSEIRSLHDHLYKQGVQLELQISICRQWIMEHLSVGHFTILTEVPPLCITKLTIGFEGMSNLDALEMQYVLPDLQNLSFLAGTDEDNLPALERLMRAIKCPNVKIVKFGREWRPGVLSVASAFLPIYPARCRWKFSINGLASNTWSDFTEYWAACQRYGIQYEVYETGDPQDHTDIQYDV